MMLNSPSTSPTLRARPAYEKFLKSAEQSPGTQEQYHFALRHWELFPLSVCPDPSQPAERIDMFDPPLHLVDNLTLQDLKNKLLNIVAPATVNKTLTHLHAILNRLGPEIPRHNPDGLGILPRSPHTKRVKVTPRRPRIGQHDELDRLYAACSACTWPVQHRTGIDPVLWWRALIVLAFNVGLRRIDLISAYWRDVDFRQHTIAWDAEKTGKALFLPLHPVVLDHLRAIVSPRPLIFPVASDQTQPLPLNRWKTAFYRTWHRIVQRAELSAHLTIHDLRRTSGDAIFRQSPAAAAELLQHSNIQTTMRSYSNASNYLGELVLNRTQPSAFMPDQPTDEPPHILRFPAV